MLWTYIRPAYPRTSIDLFYGNQFKWNIKRGKLLPDVFLFHSHWYSSWSNSYLGAIVYRIRFSNIWHFSKFTIVCRRSPKAAAVLTFPMDRNFGNNLHLSILFSMNTPVVDLREWFSPYLASIQSLADSSHKPHNNVNFDIFAKQQNQQRINYFYQYTV